ncbi:MAG: TrkH family potassium uptake protein [Alphaproteobacteria bacterium]
MIDIRPILHVIGLLLTGLAVAMVIPALADGVSSHPDWKVFAVCAAATAFVGVLLVLTTHSRNLARFNLRQSFVLTSAAWAMLSAFSALPFLFLEQELNYADAFFEAISGLTTTGATVLNGLDGLPPGMLLWRSLLHWVGGIGIVFMAIIMLPFLRVGGMQLFQTESSTDRKERVVPRPVQLVALIGLIYMALTLLCIAGYWAAGMTLFDALCHAMTTVSTGGFSTHDASFGYFQNPVIEWTAVLFMAAGAIPFVVYVRTLRGHPQVLWRHTQVRAFAIFALVICVVLALWLTFTQDRSFGDALRAAAFNAVSIITTTGFASENYILWGPFAAAIFLMLTFVGGCTGSTSGAVKIFRFQILWRVARAHLRRLSWPHRVVVISYAGEPLPEDIPPSVLAFLAAYFMTVAFITVVLAGMGYDLVTSFSAAATAIGNVGPGLGDIIGPAGNFSMLSDAAKWVLSAAMLLGRLELFTLLVLLDPGFWRD